MRRAWQREMRVEVRQRSDIVETYFGDSIPSTLKWNR